ncbi:MarR family winged helix-turn-helix transcriptional regulator [uncultured Megamonas sp.]|uniref:MarR family winged helix-turn-helix transcriptional regulator n=1 Tax=uncultured Megamonas sp. TaxID=286140 RepID=UPI00266FF338|nr:MarR family winged helix-turn-helix transcriptional regulator [uncultured Megamonas sp.]
MLSDELHFLLLKSFHHSNKNIIQKVSVLNLLPGQPKILEYLLENNGSIAKDISNGCVLDKSTITSLLLRMEKQDLITRKTHSTDKRSSYIYLTEKGIDMAQKVKKICFTVDDKALKNIPPQNKKILLETLNTVIDNLKED